MATKPHIHYLRNSEIDFAKWDSCISSSPNGLIYGYSFYLNHMASNWDALVVYTNNDPAKGYESIMPLTWNKKYTINYLYQPFLCAQLGLFSHSPSAELLEYFLQAIPSSYKYWDFYLNQQNVFELKDFSLYQRCNYILDLNNSYDQIFTKYRDNIKRNIRKAEQLGCTVVKGFEAEQVIELAIEQMKNFTKESAENIDRFRKLYTCLQQQQQAITYGILSAKKELIASCIFIFSHNRAYYILVGNHPNGRTAGASHMLIDAFIKDHAGKKMLLDFEGSDIRNLAFFYSSFGAKEEKYAGIRLNKLPFYLKWLKK